MRRAGDALGRRGGHRQLKQLSGGMRGLLGRLSVAVVVLLICTISLLSTMKGNTADYGSKISLGDLWQSAASGGWRPSSAPRSDWPPPPTETNGYLRVRCNGGLNQQRSAVCANLLQAFSLFFLLIHTYDCFHTKMLFV
uniref:Uncharacterized protein n=1 Tax=Nelumbo nucifera TaxID=4432 RepID=A0A822YYE4_NELNU|nr:TPA_asm: hypothetical protein HUJ06_007874 [Nelumbo nucifera]